MLRYDFLINNRFCIYLSLSAVQKEDNPYFDKIDTDDKEVKNCIYSREYPASDQKKQ